MYDFFYRVNNFTLLLLNVPQRYRYWLTMMMCVVLVGIWYRISYVPYCNALKNCEQQHGMFQAKADEHSKFSNAYEATKIKYQERKKEYDASLDAWQPSAFLSITTALFEYIEHHGLFFNAYRPSALSDEGWYKRHTFFLELQGSFSAMLSWLEFIEKSNFPLFCDTVHMKKIDNERVAFTCLMTALEIKKEENEANNTKKTTIILRDQHYNA